MDGAAQYRQELKQSQQSVRDMGSALRLAEERYKATGDSAQYMQERSKALQGMIDQQKRSVETARRALEQLKSQGFDANSREVQEWQAKLNNAQADLINLERQMGETTGAAGKMGDALEKAGGMDMGKLASGLGKVAAVAAAAAAAVAAMGVKTYGLVKEASDWADDLATESLTSGIGTGDLQAWDYAARMIDTDVSVIEGAMTRVIKSMSSTSKDTAAAWKTLGVSVKDVKGGLRDSQTVFWEAIDALGRVEDETTRDALAMELFGKSAKDLTPLILAGKDAWKNYTDEARKVGLVLTDTELTNLTKFNDTWQRMDATWETTKRRAAASIAPAFEKITTAITNAADAVNKYLQSEQGQKTLTEISESVSTIFTSLAENAPSAIQNIADIAAQVSSALSGTNDDANTVVSTLQGIVGILVGSAAVGAVGSFAKGIGAIGKLFGFGAGAGAAGAAGGNGIMGMVSELASSVGPVALLAITVNAIGSELDRWSTIQKFGWMDELQNLHALVNEEDLAAITSGIQGAIDSVNKNIEIRATIKPKYAAGTRLLNSFMPNSGNPLVDQLTEQEFNTLTEWVNNTLGADLETAKAKAKEMWQAAYDAAMGKGFTPEEAEEEANSVMANNPLQKTIDELEQTKTDLLSSLEQLYKLGRSPTEEELANIEALMTRAEELQTRLNVLQDDTARAMEDAYTLVKAGFGTKEDVGMALAGIEYENQQAKETAKNTYDTVHAANMAKAAELMNAGDEAGAAAIMDADAAALEHYNEAVEKADATKMQKINEILMGTAKQSGATETDLQNMQQMLGMFEQLAQIGFEKDPETDMPDITKMRGWLSQNMAQLQQMFPESDIWSTFFGWTDLNDPNAVNQALENMDAGSLYDIWNKLMQSFSEDLTSDKSSSPLLTALQAMLNNGTITEDDFTSATGLLSTAAKMKLIFGDLSGLEGDVSKYWYNLFNSDKWKGVGSQAETDATTSGENVTTGLAKGIRNKKNEAVKAARSVAQAVKDEINSALEIASPSKVMMSIGGFITEGLAEGIEGRVSSVERAVGNVAGAVMNGAAAAGRVTNTNISDSSTLYVGQMVMNNGQDADALLNRMDATRRRRRRGVGA